MAEDHCLIDESNNVKYAQKGSDFGQSGNNHQHGLELRFRNVNFSIKEKQILTNVSGVAKPSKVLAVMGPSGKSFIDIYIYVHDHKLLAEKPLFVTLTLMKDFEKGI